MGSVGHSLPGCEIGILEPPTEAELQADPEAKSKPVPVGHDGEICFRGRHVMLGYMDNEEKTAEAIDSEGWLHSGDKGKIDENGMVYITGAWRPHRWLLMLVSLGRYKELLITAGGENIAPIPIEDMIKDALAGIVDYVVLVADKRKFCSCLFVLKTAPDVNADGQPISTNKLFGDAAQVDPGATTIAEAAGDDYKGTPAWRAALQAGIASYNQNPVSQVP